MLEELPDSYDTSISTMRRVTRTARPYILKGAYTSLTKPAVKAQKDEAENNKEIFAIVGELVLIATALDTLLNSMVVQVLHLGSSPMIEPVVGTLDPVRKIEILKERAPHIQNEEWKKRVTAFVSKAESVFRQRNIACHMPAVLENGKWTLTPVSAG